MKSQYSISTDHNTADLSKLAEIIEKVEIYLAFQLTDAPTF